MFLHGFLRQKIQCIELLDGERHPTDTSQTSISMHLICIFGRIHTRKVKCHRYYTVQSPYTHSTLSQLSRIVFRIKILVWKSPESSIIEGFALSLNLLLNCSYRYW